MCWGGGGESSGWTENILNVPEILAFAWVCLPRVRGASLWMLSPFLLSVLHFLGSDHSLVKDEPEPAAP